jgi:hypothetical protein
MQLRSTRYSRWIVGALGGALLMGGLACDDKITNTVVIAATDIAIVSGDAQTAPAGTTLPNSLVVHVTDASGVALQNVPVAWRPVTSDDGTVSSAATLTNANGDASVTWTLGAGTGTQSLTASIASGASVTFTAPSN